MRFCKCGKLMTETETGFECICGIKTDKEGNILSAEEQKTAEDEAKRIAEIKKKYRYKYPNIADPVVRVTPPSEENEAEDETMSSLTPGELEKRRQKKKKQNR